MGWASSLVLCLAAWQGRGQEWGTGGRVLSIACGLSGSEAWSPEGRVGGPPWSESKDSSASQAAFEQSTEQLWLRPS